MSLITTGAESGHTRAAAALNAVCPYFTMFPLDVPLNYLSTGSGGGWVLDPFCGRGTTNYAARLLGMPSVGVDGNPVAVAIAKGKMASALPGEVVDECDAILRSSAPSEVPQGEFWEMCYHSSTFAQLCALRDALIRDCDSAPRRVLRAILMGALHGPRNKGAPSYFSNQMPRTYASKPGYAVRYWKSRQLKPEAVDLLHLVRRKAEYYLAAPPPSVESEVHLADSRTFEFAALARKFTRVVTSPPYYGMRTYVPDQWLRNWFVGGPAQVVYQPEAQMSHGSALEFAQQLAAVWARVAEACAPDAVFWVRFGGIHDRREPPREIFEESVRRANCGLRIKLVKSAGDSLRGKRQADQFRRPLKTPIEELDFGLVLEEA